MRNERLKGLLYGCVFVLVEHDTPAGLLDHLRVYIKAQAQMDFAHDAPYSAKPLFSLRIGLIALNKIGGDAVIHRRYQIRTGEGINTVEVDRFFAQWMMS